MTQLKFNFEYPHFSWLLVGLSGSGKTCLLKRMIKDHFLNRFSHESTANPEKKVYDIFVICPSAKYSGDYEEFYDKLPEKTTRLPSNRGLIESPFDTKMSIPKLTGSYQRIFSDEFDSSLVQELIDSQKELIQEYGRDQIRPILIIMDDCLEHLGHNPIINVLFTRGRHWKINVIVISQKMKGLNRIIRVNSKIVTLFRTSNSSELEQFIEEYIGRKNGKQIEAAAELAFQDPYSFIHADFLEKDFKKRLAAGLNCKLTRFLL